MSSGNTPEKRIEKKLLNAAATRDKSTSSTQDINHDVLGARANAHFVETNSPMLLSSKLETHNGNQEKNQFKKIVFRLGS
jgi:hypothetical protein